LAYIQMAVTAMENAAGSSSPMVNLQWVIDDILARGKLPILVGGTGLWLDAVVRGHGFAGGHAGGEVRRTLQKRLAEEGIEPLLMELRQVDPAAAERLHPADEKRILRALEVWLETGKTITAHNEETKRLPSRYDAVWIGLRFADREDMKALIDRRVDVMVEEGLLDEVRSLLESGLPRDATALQAIGYKEFLGVLDGSATEAEAIAEVKLRSRQYAKRQLTWLRRKTDIHWIEWEKERDFGRALQVSTEILTAAGVSYP
ncbi:MAG: tRNA (adenosine(37)-N6)-dimethylallyltransferase MiaA, partial [Oscillospiraceae bacterium]|nr:tRNA (adenosine(37)-N6)-dimethylallyltransferase MiaA [Oscillospiraceae bacterium]